MKNRLLAFALTATVAFSAIPYTTGFGFEDSADSKVVRFLEALDIMNTDKVTGFFWDETPVKRSEMAEILCNVFDFEVKEDSEARFSDVSGDARKFVETIVRYGVMSGYSKTEFGPEDYITNQQLVKIVVSMMGAQAIAEARGGYPMGYTKVAEELDLIVDTGAAMEKEARRIDVAELLYNAMHSDYVRIESYGNGFVNYDTLSDKTFLSERLGIYRIEGVVSQNEVTSLSKLSGLGENLVLIGDEVCYDKNSILEEYFGCNMTVYVKKEESDSTGEVIYAEEHKKNESLTVIDEDILSADSNTFRYFVNEKEKSVSISPIADMIYNGAMVDKDLKLLLVKNGFVKLIDNNGDSVYDVILITDYDTYIVENINIANERILLQFGEAPLNLKETEYKIYKDGQKATLSDLSKGDVLSVSKSIDSKVLRIDASSENIMGVIEEVRDGGEYATISGKELEVSKYFKKIAENGNIAQITAGKSGDYRLDVMGRIVYYTATASGLNVGYLVDSHYNDEESDVILTAKIFSVDSKIEKFSFSDIVKVNGSGMKLSKLVLDKEFLAKLETPQLVEYEAENGVIKSISFASDVPQNDSMAFSLDVEGSLSASATGVFEHKYYLSSNTKVFLVPSNADYFGNESYYELRKGPYFTSTETRSLMLYDVDDFGNVKYAVTKYDPQWARIGYGNGLVLVTSKTKGIGADGEVVDVFECLSEAGTTVTIKTDDYEGIVKNKKVRVKDSDGNTTSITISKDMALEIKVGDVIQYKTNQSGYLHAVALQHGVLEESFYKPESIEPGNTRSGIPDSVYGKVMRNDGNQLILTCSDDVDLSSGIENADKLVLNNGNAVYKVYRKAGKATVEKIEFSDILPEDKIFASVNSSNTTKMIVIYE